jgi:transcriptional regulator with XRE-family HTH domain
MGPRMSERWIVRDPESLGRAIRAFRAGAGLTQDELADQADLHRSYLSDLERGRGTEQLKRVFRVLRRLGVEVELRRRGGG